MVNTECNCLNPPPVLIICKSGDGEVGQYVYKTAFCIFIVAKLSSKDRRHIGWDQNHLINLVQDYHFGLITDNCQLSQKMCESHRCSAELEHVPDYRSAILAALFTCKPEDNFLHAQCPLLCACVCKLWKRSMAVTRVTAACIKSKKAEMVATSTECMGSPFRHEECAQLDA